jgi:hypothetical protein
MFKVLLMKIIKRLFNRQWVSLVLYAVYLHLSLTETAIEHYKCILTILLSERGEKKRPNFE